MTKVLTLKIRLLEPMLATGMEGDPNAATGLGYVPGAVLRGAAIGRYRGKREATEPVFRRLFLDGTTRFLNGYPQAGVRGTRFLPCPFSVFKDKHRLPSSHTVEDHAHPDANQDPTIQWQVVQPSAPFVRLESGSGSYIIPRRAIHVHTQRDRRKGRATTGSGAVFRYEALAAGQDFLAHVLCEDGDAGALAQSLNGDFCLGGSRTAGYGHSRIEVEGNPADIAQWSEYGGVTIGSIASVSSARLRLTFLSDTILREPTTGRYSAAPEAARGALAALLGVNVPAERCHMFLQPTTVGGFNRRWGLPLPQTTAVAMGSVIVLDGISVSEHLLKNLVIEGMGERRAEGFGRLAVDWHAGPSHDLIQADRSHAAAVVQPRDAAADASLQAIQTRIREQRIEQAVLSATTAIQVVALPAGCRSRLQNLKLEVLNELINDTTWDAGTLKKHVEELEQRKTVREKYRKICVKTGGRSKPILKWIEDFAGNTRPETITIPDFQNGRAEHTQFTDRQLYQFRLKIVAKVLGRMIKSSKTQDNQTVGV